ncbi:EamA family transporter [Enemella dayhoffiae]|uniref:EamA family transporter n=1 Tax=Enemella dayhoffiae TaxID=2016507 RepID=A0A255GSI5_9ACTN|nr:EamA family transporter [Enemella dayhoffiae]OYO18570.1 EamA family transporter [Enemella dayhoffiae]
MMKSVLGGALAMGIVGASTAVSHLLIDAPLFTAQAIRYAAAALMLILAARVLGVRVPMPRGPEWLWLIGVAAIGQVLFNIGVVRGLAHAEPAVLAVAVAGAPVIVAVVGPFLEGGRPRAAALAAAGVVVAGSGLVIGFGRTDPTGALLALLLLACEAGFTLLAVPVIGRLGAWGVSVHAVWLAAVMFAVIALPLEGPAAALSLTGPAWASIAFLAVAVTAIAFVCWYSAVRGLGSDRAVLLAGLAPVAAALAGVALVGGVPGPGVWAGMGLVAAGLAVGLRRPRLTAASTPGGLA